MLTKTERLEILAPLLAMGAGGDLDRGPVGAVMTNEYVQVIERYHPAISAAGVRRACRSRDFRPPPDKVDECCKLELEVAAERFLDASLKRVPWSREEHEKYKALGSRERYEFWQTKWTTFYSVSKTEYRSKHTNLEKARLFMQWGALEPAAIPITRDISALINQAFGKKEIGQ